MSVKAVVLFLIVSFSFLFGQSYKIKFATLAPDGSTWMNVMDEFSESLKQKTNGAVEFKIYPGGIQAASQRRIDRCGPGYYFT